MTRKTEQLPVFLLTGFLGAGKTTLLNRVLSDPAFADTALIINEFGLVSVDHDLVRQGREQAMVTTTGCICCTVGSDVRSSLDELLTGRRKGTLPPFRRVIIETTGLADPAPIINSLIPGGTRAFSLRDHALARAFRLSGVITVVDVEGIEAALADHPESLRQIAFADHAVLTRTDLTPVGDWPERLRTINPSLRVHDAHAEGFDPARLLAPGSYSAFGKAEDVESWLAEEAARPEAVGHFHDLNRHGNVVAVSLTQDEPLDPTALKRFLGDLVRMPELLRVKGLIALQDDPSRPALVHAVGHRLYPVLRMDEWPEGRAETRLVVIGSGIDVDDVRRRFSGLPERPQPLLVTALQTFRKSFPAI